MYKWSCISAPTLRSFWSPLRSEVADGTLTDEPSALLSAEATLKTCWIGLDVACADKWCFRGFGALVQDNKNAGDFDFDRLSALWHEAERGSRRHFQAEVAWLYLPSIHMWRGCKRLPFPLFSSVVVHSCCLLLLPCKMPPAAATSSRVWSFLSHI